MVGRRWWRLAALVVLVAAGCDLLLPVPETETLYGTVRHADAQRRRINKDSVAVHVRAAGVSVSTCTPCNERPAKVAYFKCASVPTDGRKLHAVAFHAGQADSALVVQPGLGTCEGLPEAGNFRVVLSR